MDTGYIKLYRVLIDKPIWISSKPEHKAIMITLLLLANHKEKEWEWMGEKFKVLPGQFITSLESIRRKTGKGISIQNIRSCLKRFQKFQFATSKSTKAGRLITIINWDSYQPKKKKSTKLLTDDQQRGNKEVTPNKNERMKECNKEYKKNIQKKDPFIDYLQEKIIENNLIENKDKIFEFYQYRMRMVQAKKYKSKKGIDGLISDIVGCRKNGLVIFDCIEKALQKEWLTPDPTYFRNNNFSRPEQRFDKNKNACVAFINEN